MIGACAGCEDDKREEVRKLSEKAQMIFDIICLLIVVFSSTVEDKYIHSLEKKIKETEVRKNDKVRDSKVHL